MTNDPNRNLQRWFQLLEDEELPRETRQIVSEQLAFFVDAVNDRDENMMFASVQTLTEAAISAGLKSLAEDATIVYAEVTADPIHQAFALTNVATWRFSAGDVVGAEQPLGSAHSIFEQHDHAEGLSRTLTISGDIQRSRGLPHEATVTYRSALLRAQSDSRRATIAARLVESILDELDLSALNEAINLWMRLAVATHDRDSLKAVITRVANIGTFLARSGVALGAGLHGYAVACCREHGFDPISTCGSLDGA